MTRIWRRSTYTSAQEAPTNSVVRENDLKFGTLEEMIADVKQSALDFVIDDVFEAGAVNSHNMTTIAQQRMHKRQRRERDMALLFFWDAENLGKTSVKALVNDRPAPLDQDDIVTVFKQLRHHPNAVGRMVYARDRKKRPVLLNDDGTITFDTPPEIEYARRDAQASGKTRIDVPVEEPLRCSLQIVPACTQTHGDIGVFPVLLVIRSEHQDTHPSDLVALLPQRLRIVHPQNQVRVIDADTEKTFLHLQIAPDNEMFQRFIALKRLGRGWYLRFAGQKHHESKPLIWHMEFFVNERNEVLPAYIPPERSLLEAAQPMAAWATPEILAEYDSPEERQARKTLFTQVLGPLPIKLRRLEGVAGNRLILSRHKFREGHRNFNALLVDTATVPLVDYETEEARSHHDWNIVHFEGLRRAVTRGDALLMGKVTPATPYHQLFINEEDNRALLDILDKASIIELHPEDDGRLANGAEAYIRSVLHLKKSHSLFAHAETLRAIRTLAQQVPAPAPLPFKAIFVALGAGRHDPALNPREQSGVPVRVGWLLNEAGYVFTVDKITEHMTLRCTYAPWVIRRPTGWVSVEDDDEKGLQVIAPWVFTLLVGALNDYRTVRITHPQQPAPLLPKSRKSQEQPRTQKLPPMYYQVTMEDITIDDTRRKLPRLKVPVNWSHTWTVSGHFYNKFQIGTLPIPPDLEHDLVKNRGYTLYKNAAEVPSRLATLLMKQRRSLPQAGQWLAHKETRKEADIRPHNRPDLPFIPSTRVPQNKMPTDDDTDTER